MSITRAQRARFHDYAPTPEDIEAVMLALDTATERLSNERSKRSQAEERIADALALCDEWAAMGTRQMSIGAVRRALGGKAGKSTALARAEARIQDVRDVLLASDDGTEYEHNGHGAGEGEPECPGCWVEGIRRALDAP